METSEKTKKPGFSRMSVEPKQQVIRQRDTHPVSIVYIALFGYMAYRNKKEDWGLGVQQKLNN